VTAGTVFVEYGLDLVSEAVGTFRAQVGQ
jgi:hypothetical protein